MFHICRSVWHHWTLIVKSAIGGGAYLSEHGTLVPMNPAMIFGTEVPGLKNDNLGTSGGALTMPACGWLFHLASASAGALDEHYFKH